MYDEDFSLLFGEKVLVFARLSFRVLVFPALFFVFLSALFGFFAAILFRENVFVWVLSVGFLIFLLFFVVWVLKPFLVWVNSYYVLTNSRVIFSRGVLRKRTQEVYLTQIKNLVFERSFGQRLFGCGNIRFDFSDESENLYFFEVSNIKNFRSELNFAIQNLPNSPQLDRRNF